MKSRIKLILLLTATLIAFTACASRPLDSIAVDKNQKILKVVLRKFKEKNTFTVVEPNTSLSPAGSSSPPPSSIVAIGKNLQKSMKDDYEVAGLVKYFFSKNKNPTRLLLKSSPEDGYLIDYSGKFAKYFEKNGGGRESWQEENPNAKSYTRVSIPVIDKEAGVVLVYIGTQSGWLTGAGQLIAYKYEDGKLKEIGRAMLWIS